MQSQQRLPATELSSGFLNMLGLCMRAGCCLFGETACLNTIRAGHARLVMVDASASDNTRKRFGDACAFRKVPLLFYERDKGDVAHAVGKPAHKLFAVSDQAFAAKLISMVSKGDFNGTLGVEL